MSDEQPIAPGAEPPPTLDDAIREAEAISADGRLWLKVIVSLLEAYHRGPQWDGNCHDALDSLMVAACARAKRILRSDLKSG